jgi:DNA-directed RNA polymerase subunit RPC12/RpoP
MEKIDNRVESAWAVVDGHARRSPSALSFVSQYDAQWHRYRLLTRCGVAAALMVPGGFLAACWVDDQFSWGHRAFPVLIALAFVSMITLMVVALIRSYFRCPRCSKAFSWSKWGLTQSLSHRCVHCGLRLYE